jgi:hypothetical protein
MKKMLNKGNQIHDFISSFGSDCLTSYGSGSASQKVTAPTVPVPLHWFHVHFIGNYLGVIFVKSGL